jgi:hypothetical protein
MYIKIEKNGKVVSVCRTQQHGLDWLSGFMKDEGCVLREITLEQYGKIKKMLV